MCTAQWLDSVENCAVLRNNIYTQNTPNTSHLRQKQNLVLKNQEKENNNKLKLSGKHRS